MMEARKILVGTAIVTIVAVTILVDLVVGLEATDDNDASRYKKMKEVNYAAYNRRHPDFHVFTSNRTGIAIDMAERGYKSADVVKLSPLTVRPVDHNGIAIAPGTPQALAARITVNLLRSAELDRLMHESNPNSGRLDSDDLVKYNVFDNADVYDREKPSSVLAAEQRDPVIGRGRFVTSRSDLFSPQVGTWTQERQTYTFDNIVLRAPFALKYTFEVRVCQYWNNTDLVRSHQNRTADEDDCNAGVEGSSLPRSVLSFRKRFAIAIFSSPVVRGMEFLRLPAPWMNDHTPLTQQPVLRLVDAAGNTAKDAEGTISVTVRRFWLQPRWPVPSPPTDGGGGTSYLFSYEQRRYSQGDGSGIVLHALAECTEGLAQFTSLHFETHPHWNYTLNFTFHPQSGSPSESSYGGLYTGPRGQSEWKPAVSREVTIKSSMCNRTSSNMFAYFFPDRARQGDETWVTIRGAVFPFRQKETTYCRYPKEDGDDPAAYHVLPALWLDECNVQCHFPSNDWGGGNYALRGRISLSLDGGRHWSDGPRFMWLGTASALQVLFDRPRQEYNSIIVLDPFGFTRVGNMTLLLLDENDVAFHHFGLTEYVYNVEASFRYESSVQLEGTTAATMTNGRASFHHMNIIGYPPEGNYTMYFKATRTDGEQTVLGRRRVFLRSTDETCKPLPEVLSAASKECYGGTWNDYGQQGCVRYRPVTVTITGKYFGLDGAAVYANQTPCTDVVHDSSDLASVLYASCHIVGEAWISVKTKDSNYGEGSTALLKSNVAVEVHNVSGCPIDFPPSTSSCWSNSSTNVTISGSNFGSSGASVWVQSYYNPSWRFRCLDAFHLSASPMTTLQCTLPAAVGEAYRFEVTNNELHEVGWSADATANYAITSGALCPQNEHGAICSLHGECDLSSGVCGCHEDPGRGYWAGEACSDCKEGYYGAECRWRCPDCVRGQSTCDQGVNGTGKCLCFYGYGGTHCEIPCPTVDGTPCAGNGLCLATDGTCQCYGNTTHGYWLPADCGSCIEGYSGVVCNKPCPRNPINNNTICSDAGPCLDGYCLCQQNYCDVSCNRSYTECGGCSAGLWGADCALECPGQVGATTTYCTGHGFCSDGPYGSGRCSCNAGYAGAVCNISCPPDPSNACYGHGSCVVDTGLCDCYAGYGRADCSTLCPGTSFLDSGKANVTCSGHGLCHNENATCKCDFGYAGLDCLQICPGGALTPCQFHGECDHETAQCQCHFDSVRGHWSGEDCARCAAEWHGSNCDGQCVKVDAVQCAGHGSCTDTLECKCFQTELQGYWFNDNCTTCVDGYYGAGCILQCPGTACNPCNFHGNCSQGPDGDGTCACEQNDVDGYWSGEACARCSFGYYGRTCTLRCPEGRGSLVCSGRGTCDDDVAGSGVCRCAGNYHGEACERCQESYYGLGCALKCPGWLPGNISCNGHGWCNSTEYSRGVCHCDEGYGGVSCELLCPVTSDGICNRKGLCVFSPEDRQMICVECAQSASTGYWTGGACEQCSAGYYGSGCKSECPGGAASPCNGEGLCSDGTDGDGTCTCRSGYAGLDCSLICAGGALLPCSGHGECNSLDGTCTCDSDTANGFWTSTDCSECRADHAGSTCAVPCPQYNSEICAARGTCYEGVCTRCDSGYCGVACERSGATCIICPSGTWGPSCQDCPGKLDSLVCNGNGTCVEGYSGTGLCYCDFGFRGTACENRCPGPLDDVEQRIIPCFGHGTCFTNASCGCGTGWAGVDCNTICKGFDDVTEGALPCNGVGQCDPLQGSCSCDYGHGGEGCDIACPGTAEGAPCNNNGICNVNGTCDCYLNVDTGYWGGEACERCASGYFGTSCQEKCQHGVSDETFTQCVCDEYYYGLACQDQCPGMLTGVPCSGHGNCSWGREATGLCSCNSSWYDTVCNVFCNKTLCDAELTNGQCNKAKGFCECQFDDDQPQYGFWVETPAEGSTTATTAAPTPAPTGSAATLSPSNTSAKLQCTSCHKAFFGEQCELPCLCNGHGLCNRRTGDCSCDSGIENGYWGGKVCSECQDGFVGITCKGVNVKLSRLGAYGASVPVPSLTISAGMLCYDVVHGYSYVGTDPIAILDSKGEMLATYRLGGYALRCVFRSEKEVSIYVFSPNYGRIVVFTRGTVYEADRYDFPHLTSSIKATLLAAEQAGNAAAEAMNTFDRGMKPQSIVRSTLEPGSAVSQRGFGVAAATPDSPTNDSEQQVAFESSGLVQPIELQAAHKLLIPYKFGVIQYRDVSLPTSHPNAIRNLLTDFETIESVSPSNNHSLVVLGTLLNGQWEIQELITTLTDLSLYRLPVLRSYRSAFAAKLELQCPSCQPVRIASDRDGVVVVLRRPTQGMYLARLSLAEAQYHTALAQGGLGGITTSIAPTNGPASSVDVQSAAPTGSPPLSTTLAPSNSTNSTANGTLTNGTVVNGTSGSNETATPDPSATAVPTTAAPLGVLQMDYSPFQDILVVQYVFSEEAQVTALVIDDYTSLGYTAMRASEAPSTILKFVADSCVVTGMISLGVVGADREVAVAMDPRLQYRKLDVLAPLGSSQRVIELSLFAVASIRPEFADTKGGTIITVLGEGFIGGMHCDFEGRKVLADFIGEKELRCVAPAGGTESCTGELVEILHPASGQTNNKKTIRRLPSALVRKVTNNETGLSLGFTSGGLVRVEGAGFTDCIGCHDSLMKCMLYSPTAPNSSVTVTATPLSSNLLTCLLPAIEKPIPKPSFLEVSIDGAVFSDSKVSYEVLGTAAQLYISKPVSQKFTVKSSDLTKLPDIEVTIADSVAHPLGKYYQGRNTHIVEVSVFVAESLLASVSTTTVAPLPSSGAPTDTAVPMPSSGSSSGSLTMPNETTVTTAQPVTSTLSPALSVTLIGTVKVRDVDSVSLFSNLTLVRPGVGKLKLLFREPTKMWSTVLPFEVTEGEPHHLLELRKPSNETDNRSPTLPMQPIIGVSDIAGNVLSNLKDKEIVVERITIITEYHDTNDLELKTRELTAFATENTFRVEGVSITGKHRHTYHINYRAIQLPNSTLRSDPISVKACRDILEFAVENSTDCRPCPTRAHCDGTFTVTALDNYWRGDNISHNFYYCGAPYSGDSCYNDSQCVGGYDGPRCSECTVGYGRAGRRCVECGSIEGNYALVTFIIVIVLLILVYLIYSVITGGSADLFPIIFRNFVTHMQILSRLGDLLMPWPTLLQTLWDILRKAEIQSIDVAPIDCAFQLNYYEKYVVLLVTPFAFILAVTPFAYLVCKIWSNPKEDQLLAAAVTATEEMKRKERPDTVAKLQLARIHAQLGNRRFTLAAGFDSEGRRLSMGSSHHHHRRRKSAARSEGGASSAHDDDSTAPVGSVLNTTRLQRIANALVQQNQGTDDNGFSQLTAADTRVPRSARSGTLTARDKDIVNAAGGVNVLMTTRTDFVQNILKQRKERFHMKNVVIVTAVIIFSLMYPTLVQSSGTILICEDLDLGTSLGFQSVASFSRSTFCDSTYYKFYRTLAIGMIVGYGLTIPGGVLLVVPAMSKLGGAVKARTVLAFLMNGLKSELWFWETINMLRKFTAMLVIVFVTDAKLQVIIFMWTIVAGFLLHVNLQPYTSRPIHLVEACGQSAMVVTLNLVLLFFFIQESELETGNGFALSVAVLIVNVVAVLAYLLISAKFLQLRFHRWREERATRKEREEAARTQLEGIQEKIAAVEYTTERQEKLLAEGDMLARRLDELHGGEPVGGVVGDWTFPVEPQDPFEGLPGCIQSTLTEQQSADDDRDRKGAARAEGDEEQKEMTQFRFGGSSFIGDVLSSSSSSSPSSAGTPVNPLSCPRKTKRRERRPPADSAELAGVGEMVASSSESGSAASRKNIEEKTKELSGEGLDVGLTELHLNRSVTFSPQVDVVPTSAKEQPQYSEREAHLKATLHPWQPSLPSHYPIAPDSDTVGPKHETEGEAPDEIDPALLENTRAVVLQNFAFSETSSSEGGGEPTAAAQAEGRRLSDEPGYPKVPSFGVLPPPVAATTGTGTLTADTLRELQRHVTPRGVGGGEAYDLSSDDSAIDELEYHRRKLVSRGGPDAAHHPHHKAELVSRVAAWRELPIDAFIAPVPQQELLFEEDLTAEETQQSKAEGTTVEESGDVDFLAVSEQALEQEKKLAEQEKRRKKKERRMKKRKEEAELAKRKKKKGGAESPSPAKHPRHSPRSSLMSGRSSETDLSSTDHKALRMAAGGSSDESVDFVQLSTAQPAGQQRGGVSAPPARTMHDPFASIPSTSMTPPPPGKRRDKRRQTPESSAKKKTAPSTTVGKSAQAPTLGFDDIPRQLFFDDDHTEVVPEAIPGPPQQGPSTSIMPRSSPPPQPLQLSQDLASPMTGQYGSPFVPMGIVGLTPPAAESSRIGGGPKESEVSVSRPMINLSDFLLSDSEEEDREEKEVPSGPPGTFSGGASLFPHPAALSESTSSATSNKPKRLFRKAKVTEEGSGVSDENAEAVATPQSSVLSEPQQQAGYPPHIPLRTASTQAQGLLPGAGAPMGGLFMMVEEEEEEAKPLHANAFEFDGTQPLVPPLAGVGSEPAFDPFHLDMSAFAEEGEAQLPAEPQPPVQSEKNVTPPTTGDTTAAPPSKREQKKRKRKIHFAAELVESESKPHYSESPSEPSLVVEGKNTSIAPPPEATTATAQPTTGTPEEQSIPDSGASDAVEKKKEKKKSRLGFMGKSKEKKKKEAGKKKQKPPAPDTSTPTAGAPTGTSMGQLPPQHQPPSSTPPSASMFSAAMLSSTQFEEDEDDYAAYY